MKSGPCLEIVTEHSPLIHPARDIQFQINYTNGVNPAQITDIGKRNIQSALEAFFSKNGLPITAFPVGDKDCVNLEFETPHEFIPGTLKVLLSGDELTPLLDFTEDLDRKGFKILLDPEDPERLNAPPQDEEDLVVQYQKRITFNTKGGT